MSGPQIIDVEQGTPEWFAARSGIPTASMFATVMAKGRGGGDSKTRQKYLYQLAGERITEQPAESFSNAAMERGHAMEADARRAYAFMHDCEPVQVGFIRNGDKGASPDALIGDDGMVEIKSKAPHLLIEILLNDHLPPEHMAQLQGGLWVAERAWIDLVCFYTGMPLWVRRVYRDEAYIARLSEAVSEFNAELEDVVQRIRAMGAT